MQLENTPIMNIKVEYLEEAQSYIDNMPDKARKKLFHNVGLVSMGMKDDRIFKKLTESGIWEVATHGFGKKTQKTPKSEITHAEKIRDEYYKTR